MRSWLVSTVRPVASNFVLRNSTCSFTTKEEHAGGAACFNGFEDLISKKLLTDVVFGDPMFNGDRAVLVKKLAVER
jgi:hypothetical protein